MKKLIVVFTTLSFILGQNIYAQRGEYILNFSGIDVGSSESVTIDEVHIVNLTRDCDTLISGPDPVFVLDFVDNIFETKAGIDLGKVYPNPTTGKSFVEVISYRPQHITCNLSNSSGQTLLRTNFEIGVGIQKFEIGVGNLGFYNLDIVTEDKLLNIKIISTGESAEGGYFMNRVSSVNNTSYLKNHSSYSGFIFEPGDELQVIGKSATYPDESITLIPEGNDDIIFGMRPVPIAGIIIHDSVGAFPFTTNFTDNSERNPTFWEWSFGDGNYSTNQNSYHTYQISGYYSVSLVAGNEYGTDTLVLNDYIYVKDLELFCDTASGYAPLLVNFAGICNATDIISWSWEFGDGETSNEQNPTHIFTNPGSYNHVKVMVVTSTSVYKDSTIIRVFNDLAEVNFTADIVNGWAPQVVSFTSYTNIQNPNYYQWSFGDGNGSNDATRSTDAALDGQDVRQGRASPPDHYWQCRGCRGRLWRLAFHQRCPRPCGFGSGIDDSGGHPACSAGSRRRLCRWARRDKSGTDLCLHGRFCRDLRSACRLGRREQPRQFVPACQWFLLAGGCPRPSKTNDSTCYGKGDNCRIVRQTDTRQNVSRDVDCD